MNRDDHPVFRADPQRSPPKVSLRVDSRKRQPLADRLPQSWSSSTTRDLHALGNAHLFIFSIFSIIRARAASRRSASRPPARARQVPPRRPRRRRAVPRSAGAEFLHDPRGRSARPDPPVARCLVGVGRARRATSRRDPRSVCPRTVRPHRFAAKPRAVPRALRRFPRGSRAFCGAVHVSPVSEPDLLAHHHRPPLRQRLVMVTWRPASCGSIIASCRETRLAQRSTGSKPLVALVRA